jgi:hypothetical protein
MEKAIDTAFDAKKVKPKAVCLEINSMGGSAVQSNLIFNPRPYQSIKIDHRKPIELIDINQ